VRWSPWRTLHLVTTLAVGSLVDEGGLDMVRARRRTWHSIVALSCLFGTGMPGLSRAGAQQTTAQAGMDQGRLSRIPARMNEFVATNAIPGAVTLVTRHGVVASLEAVGYQDWDAKVPMRTDAIFQVRSMTKPVTAVAILILLEDGRLLLTDPVERYLPEFRDQTIHDRQEKPRRPITIRDLLTHTSGIAAPAPTQVTDVPLAMSTLADLVNLVARRPLEFEPGTRWAYSDTGFLTLGRIVEVASGQPYEQFVATRILEPLGMTNSFFVPPAEKRGRIVATHVFENGTWRNVYADLYPPGAKLSSPAFGMHSTAEDMAAFYQMMLNRGVHQGGQFLSISSIDMMTAVHTADLQAGFSPGMGWGLGLEIVRERTGMLPVGAFGHGAASSSYAWVDSQKDLVGVILVIARGAGNVRDTFVTLAEAAAGR